MSARGHRPSARPASGREVGGIAHFKWAGVSDWTKSAASDPADIVSFDLDLDYYIGHGFAGMSIAEVSALRNERKASR